MKVVHVGAEEFRRQLAFLLNQVGYGGDLVVVERHNQPLAVLAPFTLLAQLQPSILTSDDNVSTRDEANEMRGA